MAKVQFNATKNYIRQRFSAHDQVSQWTKNTKSTSNKLTWFWACNSVSSVSSSRIFSRSFWFPLERFCVSASSSATTSKFKILKPLRAYPPDDIRTEHKIKHENRFYHFCETKLKTSLCRIHWRTQKFAEVGIFSLQKSGKNKTTFCFHV